MTENDSHTTNERCEIWLRMTHGQPMIRLRYDWEWLTYNQWEVWDMTETESHTNNGRSEICSRLTHIQPMRRLGYDWYWMPFNQWDVVTIPRAVELCLINKSQNLVSPMHWTEHDCLIKLNNLVLQLFGIYINKSKPFLQNLTTKWIKALAGPADKAQGCSTWQKLEKACKSGYISRYYIFQIKR